MLTPEAKGALKLLMQSIEQVHLQRVDYDKPMQLLVLASHFAPNGVFFGKLDPLHGYICLFLLLMLLRHIMI